MAEPPTEVSYSNLPTISLADKLRLAASKGQLDTVEELLQARATFETDRERRTALHYAALNGYPDVCRCLISHGCDIDKQDAIGFTALHRACSQGHTAVCKVLLEEGCAKDLQDEHGNTALHEASWNGYSKTLDVLVKNNCKVSIQNKSGFTPLHLAAQNGHNESSRILIYSGCSTDIKNNYGDTSLHTAARYGHAGVARILISARCSLNDENKNGDTPLHIAAALKRRKIAKLLVEAGVDCSLRNKQNETAADVARRKEYPEIILIISANHKGKARPHQIVPEDKQAVHIAVDGPNMVFRGNAPTAANKETAKPEKERRFFFFKRKKKQDKDRGSGPEHPQPTTSRQQQQQPQRLHTPHQVNKSNPVQGFFNKYVPKEGFQYYRDLAGNIKEGPIGYTPICQCMPIVKRIEKNMDETKENLYDHIDASHQILQNRINQLDKRTSQQVFSIDRLNKERLDASHSQCKQHIDTQFNQQRKNAERLYTKYNENVKSELQAWLETRLTDEESCHPHHHDDSGFYHRSVFFDVVENENGRLFRSRSDETLSQSDYSVRHRKKDFYENRQAAMQQIRAWQTPDRYRRRDNYPVRDSSLRQLPNVSVRNVVTVPHGPSITRPRTMIECTSPNQTSSFNPPPPAIAQLSLESSPTSKAFENRAVKPFTPSKLRHSTLPSKANSPNLPSTSSQGLAPGHSGTLKHQSQVMPHLSHSSQGQKDERQNLVERGPPEVSKMIGPGMGPNNVFTSNQPTLRQFNENSMEKDSKETVRNQRQFLTVSSYSVTKTSETQLLQTKQFLPKSPAAKNSNEDSNGMRPRSHSQDMLADSSSRDIIREKKCIGYYHSERTMPLDRSKSYGNLKEELSGTQSNSVTLQSNTAMMSQYSHHQSYTVPTPFKTAPPPNSAYSNSVNNTKYTRPSMADSAAKSYGTEAKQSPQKDMVFSNSSQSVCKEQYQKQMQKGLSQTALDYTSPYKNPTLDYSSPYKNPALNRTSPYKNTALSYHSNSKNMLGNQQMDNPNLNDTLNPLSRSEPQLMKADSSDGHHYRNSPTALSSKIVNAPTNNSSAAACVQNNSHQNHWSSSPLQKSNSKLSSPMLDWCHKEDSSSNPDSGYSCRIYGNGNNRSSTLLNTSHSNTATPTSSFSGTDQSPSTASASLQLSPYRGQLQNQVARDSYDDRQSSNKQYFESVTAHLQNWYSKKKLETSQKEVPKTLSPTLLQQHQQQIAPSFGTNNPYLATNYPPTPVKGYIRGSDV
ncbi:ankyrin repeat domain-containing protein 31 isoform X1 [Octopus bimaculoides]|nr:ankyrin repeat domain-containing protein 31 isoform X1 [Octopus bimaculoides]|eukprot:XP_014778973.1 PREDICTED: uncharacterized protein LOC106875383 isoform X1 [Octopus bimaculoides]